MKKIISLLIISIMIFVSVGCSTANIETTDINEVEEDINLTEEILGTWIYTDESESEISEITLTFNEDETFEETVILDESGISSTEVYTGSYSLDEYELSFTVEEGQEEIGNTVIKAFLTTPISIMFNGNELTLTPEGSTSFIFTRVD